LTLKKHEFEHVVKLDVEARARQGVKAGTRVVGVGIGSSAPNARRDASRLDTAGLGRGLPAATLGALDHSGGQGGGGAAQAAREPADGRP
jgi:hypothetical protein